MKKIRIPGELPKGGALKVIISVGTLGFKRTEYLKEDEWRPGGIFYTDNDTVSVSFESSTTPNKIIKRGIDLLKIP